MRLPDNYIEVDYVCDSCDEGSDFKDEYKHCPSCDRFLCAYCYAQDAANRIECYEVRSPLDRMFIKKPTDYYHDKEISYGH